ncbi:uncharacterized protein ASPGLDRAFT_784299 [Aspergillus glaucus CBS 516.65]|uniref:Uncharacterized protein n=1 Tax=Aspergillus glaucus CBS 516.65 TaxID=1160497 RepID=A0A1L9VBC1_ASPGL|nr:hypothetical protein ASPGLDRAFT_784299 [Aspergillus glaucus CBS 516.65]OJJ81189.1 hypothetical protein ASPGLDRAFT_784299 [Aspergillus glaucus CBS 516.65]
MIYRFSFFSFFFFYCPYPCLFPFSDGWFSLHCRFEVHAWRLWSRSVSFVSYFFCLSCLCSSFSFTIVYGFGDRMAICFISFPTFIWSYVFFFFFFFFCFIIIGLAMFLLFMHPSRLALGAILYDRRGQFSRE